MAVLIERIKSLPGLRQYRRARYRRHFERQGTYNLFYGVYPSFIEAQADAPDNRTLGYDTPAAAAMYEDHLDRTWPEHYPVLFWLSRGWGRYRRVLDFGGHRGSLFYSSRRLLGPGPAWFVYDVPAVVEEGRRRASSTSTEGLAFESDLSRVPPVDVLIAAGSLQYVEDSAAEWLARVGGEPQTIIVSTTPFHPSREFVTLNNMGTAYCPYKVRRYAPFLDQLRDAGYEVIEEWHHPGKQCHVPFHVGPWEVTYRGAILERRPSSSPVQ